MPIPFLAEVLFKGFKQVPGSLTLFKLLGALIVVSLIKFFSMGATNKAEKKLHSKVVMITGGTSGIGAMVAYDLALRGAQIILLTRQSPSDMFVVDFIEDLRERTGNQLIYAEQVDLSSLYSIRQFATKWIDNAPPRRLDMIILCAATLTPPGKARSKTREGLEETWAINYLANFHLLSILSPAIRAQPPDRDVRIIFATCSSYLRSPAIGSVEEAATSVKDWSPSKAYARSKLALMTFGHAFQKHLDAYKRPDGMPMNARVTFVDPGYSRTPGMRRWLTRGTLWGLAIYLTLWQNIWLLLKSAEGGAQSILHAAMDVSLERGSGCRLIKECQEMAIGRAEVKDETAAKKLWEGSEKLIERVEREEAVKRALEKKERELAEKQKEKSGEKTDSKAGSAGDSTKESKEKPSRRQRKANKSEK